MKEYLPRLFHRQADGSLRWFLVKQLPGIYGRV